MECQGCPVMETCTKSKIGRQIHYGVQLERMKKHARERLLSPRGLKMRSLRPIEVEAVFGRLKQNWGFRRFLLRGVDKVKTEWGLLSLAHNIAKVAVS